MWEGTERLEIRAPPKRVWEIVTDLHGHVRLAGSGEVQSVDNLSGPLAIGTTWDSAEQVPKAGKFVAHSRVTQLDPPKIFAWVSFPPPLSKRQPTESQIEAHWRFELTPSGAGTLVEHSFRVVEPRVGAGKLKMFYALTGRAKVIQRGMKKTLENLKREVERT
jgi:uncharacterized protein YndB with AHSA1/START domain